MNALSSQVRQLQPSNRRIPDPWYTLETYPSWSFPIVIVVHCYAFIANAEPPRYSTFILQKQQNNDNAFQSRELSQILDCMQLPPQLNFS